MRDMGGTSRVTETPRDRASSRGVVTELSVNKAVSILIQFGRGVIGLCIDQTHPIAFIDPSLGPRT